MFSKLQVFSYTLLFAVVQFTHVGQWLQVWTSHLGYLHCYYGLQQKSDRFCLASSDPPGTAHHQTLHCEATPSDWHYDWSTVSGSTTCWGYPHHLQPPMIFELSHCWLPSPWPQVLMELQHLPILITKVSTHHYIPYTQ